MDDPRNGNPTTPATASATEGIGKASVSFDFRAREFAVMTGTALGRTNLRKICVSLAPSVRASVM